MCVLYIVCICDSFILNKENLWVFCFLNNIIGIVIGNVFGFCKKKKNLYRFFSEFMCVYIGNNKY